MIKQFRVTVDGKPYDVTAEVPDESDGGVVPASNPGPAPVPTVAAPAPASPLLVASQTMAAPTPSISAAKSGSSPGDVPSPLAGRVIALVAKVGQEVKENDHLLTLEAMKMNTFVFAPMAGKILEVKVAVGDAVTEGQALVRIG